MTSRRERMREKVMAGVANDVYRAMINAASRTGDEKMTDLQARVGAILFWIAAFPFLWYAAAWLVSGSVEHFTR